MCKVQKQPKPMECYKPGCNQPAQKTNRCFAYCSMKHKSEVVGKERREVPNRQMSIREIQIALRQMGRNVQKKKMKKPKQKGELKPQWYI